MFPEDLADFSNYLSFVDDADVLLEEMGLRGQTQIVSFHLDYVFKVNRLTPVAISPAGRLIH